MRIFHRTVVKSYEEILDEIADQVDGEFTAWEDMTEEELSEWLEVVRNHEAKKNKGPPKPPIPPVQKL